MLAVMAHQVGYIVPIWCIAGSILAIGDLWEFIFMSYSYMNQQLAK